MSKGDSGISFHAMDYAKAFRILRAAFGLRQAELAERLTIGPSQLSLIEAGKRQPSLKTVEALAEALGVPQALVMLLASEPQQLQTQEDRDIADLGRTLLRLLVAASKEKATQGRLPFDKAGE